MVKKGRKGRKTLKIGLRGGIIELNCVYLHIKTRYVYSIKNR